MIQHQQTQEDTRDYMPVSDLQQNVPVGSEAARAASILPSQPETTLEPENGLPILQEQDTRTIARLRRKAGRRSFLPQMDAYWENPGPLNEEKFGAVLAGLRNPSPTPWRERMLCAWLLGHALLTPQQQTEAVHALGKVAQNRHAPHSQQIRAHLQKAALLTLPLTAVLAAWNTWQLVLHTFLNRNALDFGAIFLLFALVFAVFFAGLFPLFAALSTTLNVSRNNRVRAAAVLALARLRVPEAVGPLARAVLAINPGVRSVAEEGLRQCLPQITPGHYARLEADTVPALCRLLDVKKERLFANHAHTEQLVLEALEALGKIGDGSAVRHVESVAEDGWTEAVRKAAYEILPRLRERQQQENNPRLLLRGSSQPQADSDQLLRATLTAQNILPEQLLRPGNRE